jgi:PAT family acetyl-CoA transporter-like MFS transporter 1
MSTRNANNRHPSTSRWKFRTEEGLPSNSTDVSLPVQEEGEHDDFFNYILLILLYTLQGIPMGLSGSIPFLIQQKVQASEAAAALSAGVASTAVASSKLAYQANAIFALCSWPFSLKLLWAPIVDACFVPALGRRKTWLIPCQFLAGLLMVGGANYVEQQLGLTHGATHSTTIHVKGVTLFFFGLYFLLATQDIAVDGWALTMLSKKNRGRGPICNSIGQNIGYFLSFVGFLALNDPESSEMLWRPLLRLPSRPGMGLVSLGGFIRAMGYFMLATTIAVALFKHERTIATTTNDSGEDDDAELDASQIGVKETYHRLWAVCQLPAVRTLFGILLTYRIPTALSDNVKFLKAVEYGLSKSTTALLSPTVILPLGILVPLVATRIWHGRALRQFLTGYQFRVTLVPLLDLWMLHILKSSGSSRGLLFWIAIVSSTAAQAIVNSLQFNAQMTFFASRVDPLIGGSYMTLLNTAANLGGTYPASLVMWLLSAMSKDPVCRQVDGETLCTAGRDPFVPLQIGSMVLGCFWIVFWRRRVQWVEHLPDDAWRTHLTDTTKSNSALDSVDVELGGNWTQPVTRKDR